MESLSEKLSLLETVNTVKFLSGSEAPGSYVLSYTKLKDIAQTTIKLFRLM